MDSKLNSKNLKLKWQQLVKTRAQSELTESVSISVQNLDTMLLGTRFANVLQQRWALK